MTMNIEFESHGDKKWLIRNLSELSWSVDVTETSNVHKQLQSPCITLIIPRVRALNLDLASADLESLLGCSFKMENPFNGIFASFG